LAAAAGMAHYSYIYVCVYVYVYVYIYVYVYVHVYVCPSIKAICLPIKSIYSYTGIHMSSEKNRTSGILRVGVMSHDDVTYVYDDVTYVMM